MSRQGILLDTKAYPPFVRRAALSDVDAMCAIAASTFAMACPPDTPELELNRYIDANLTAACFAAALSISSCEVRVAESCGEILGFSIVNHKPERIDVALANDMPELQRCYVAQRAHGTGVAQLLLTETLARLSTVRLMVNDQNRRAISFYRRNGFTVVGDAIFQCGDDVHRDLVMVRLRNPSQRSDTH